VILLTSVQPQSELLIGAVREMCKMERRFDIVTIVSAVGVAGYVAAAVGYVSLHEFGLSGEAVRSGAAVAAIMIGAAVAVDFLSKQFGNAE
jgi:Zn-dependent protease